MTYVQVKDLSLDFLGFLQAKYQGNFSPFLIRKKKKKTEVKAAHKPGKQQVAHAH